MNLIHLIHIHYLFYLTIYIVLHENILYRHIVERCTLTYNSNIMIFGIKLKQVSQDIVDVLLNNQMLMKKLELLDKSFLKVTLQYYFTFRGFWGILIRYVTKNTVSFMKDV